MRILRVAPYIYPDTKGGGAYHVFALSRDQAAMGHDVTVLTVCEDESLPKVEETDGFTILRVSPGLTLFGNDISSAVARYLWGVNSEDFDVIHAHSHLYFSTNLAALKRRLGDISLAITNHGLYSQSAPKQVFDIYLKTLGRWTFNQANIVFCYTDEDRRRVRELGVNSDIAVVPNGIDTSRFTPDGSESDLIDHDGLVILFVGRLVEGKCPQDAIEAVAEIPTELDAKLYVVGDGPMREELGALGRNAVKFLGHVPYDEMPAVYRAGDVLILPSRAEGLPRTVLEAFASGVPVVSSHLEHTASVVQKGGETVPVGDITAYSSALNRVLNDRDQLGKQGREAAVEKFRWESTVEETTQRLELLR
jgi:glycosyltransferase involved in cell wall biosynthesis